MKKENKQENTNILKKEEGANDDVPVVDGGAEDPSSVEPTEEKGETVIAPFDTDIVSNSQTIDDEGVTSSGATKTIVDTAHRVSMSRLWSRFSHIRLETVWTVLVVIGGVSTLALFLYAGAVFMDTLHVEERVSLGTGSEDVVVGVSEERVKHVRDLYREREELFETLKNDPPRIPEVR